MDRPAMASFKAPQLVHSGFSACNRWSSWTTTPRMVLDATEAYALATAAPMFRTIQGMAPGLADDIARQFDGQHESGESGELLWEWAKERGIDPQQIIDEVRAKLAKENAS